MQASTPATLLKAVPPLNTTRDGGRPPSVLWLSRLEPARGRLPRDLPFMCLPEQQLEGLRRLSDVTSSGQCSMRRKAKAVRVCTIRIALSATLTAHLLISPRLLDQAVVELDLCGLPLAGARLWTSRAAAYRRRKQAALAIGHLRSSVDHRCFGYQAALRKRAGIMPRGGIYRRGSPCPYGGRVKHAGVDRPVMEGRWSIARRLLRSETDRHLHDLDAAI